MQTKVMAAVFAAQAILMGADAYPNIPRAYLEEAASIPKFWVTTVDEVSGFLDTQIRKGQVRQFGETAGGRAMRAVFYGSPRQGTGATTYSGSLGYRDVRAWFGPDHGKKVYLAMAAVHGGEMERLRE